jgi:glycosyltransferase involved in cell wall biosynthesis
LGLLKILRVRIVFLNPVAEFGGAERSLLAWMRAVRQAFPEAELTLVVPGDGLLRRRALAEGVMVEILRVPDSIAGLGDSALREDSAGRSAMSLFWRVLRAGPTVWDYARRLRHLLDDLRPDLVHSNGIKTHLALRLATWPIDPRARRVPIVWHLHDFVGARPVVSRIVRWASRGVATVVAVSKAVATDGRAVLASGIPVTVVYNAVDVEKFRPAPGDGRRLDELSGLSTPDAQQDQPVRVVLVATYARWKGQDVFLEAAARVVCDPQCPPVRFYIAGGQIYRTSGSQFSQEELREKAEKLGLSTRVGFIPFQDDPVEIYRCADVVVHASTRPEPFGLTIVEAMACARAVIVSLAGGAVELVTDGEEAVGIVPRDSASLAKAIVRLANNPKERDRLGQNAREAILSRFDANELVKQITLVYVPRQRRER